MWKCVLVAVVVFAPISYSEVINVTQCNENQSLPASVNIANCSSTPCKFIEGSNFTFAVNFTAAETVNMYAVRVSLNITTPNAICQNQLSQAYCENLLDGSCSLEKGGNYSLTYTTSLQNSCPAHEGVLKVSIEDVATGTSIACFKVPTELTVPVPVSSAS